MRRNKKLASMVVASALVATAMAMPVMAADEGEVNVTVTNRNAVIRVEVPTTLAVAVNQFEKGDSGSQIYSGDFTIKNKSEIPVKMTVTSKATLASTDTINLLATKDAVEKSTEEKGEAWLAVAAKATSTDYIEGAGKTLKDLTEKDKNVTTFVQGTDTAKNTATAEQTFCLGAVASPTVTYTKVDLTDADKVAAAKKVSYAQYYKLTELATQPTTDAAVQAAVDAADVYAIDGSDVVTFMEKGKTGVTFATGSKYYSATPVEPADFAQNDTVVYGEAGAGEDTAFRYIGKLSEGKDTWTDNDLSAIQIKYNIVGLTGTKFTEMKDDRINGLYIPVVGPQAALSASGEISITGLTKEQNYVSAEITVPNGAKYDVNTNPVAWNTANWNTEGGTITGQLGTEWMDWLVSEGGNVTLTINLSDSTTKTCTATLTN